MQSNQSMGSMRLESMFLDTAILADEDNLEIT